MSAIAWSSRKCSPSTANKLLAKEVARMAAKGYALQSSDIVQAGRSKRSWVLLGLLNFLRGKQVQATAIFVRAEEKTRDSGPEHNN